MANLSDTTYSIIREVVAGTTPATPAFKPLDVNSFDITLESNMLTSEVMRNNRAAGDSYEQGFYTTGSLSTDFRNDAAIDMMLEGGFGGAFSSKVLKAGNTDFSHTFEQKMIGATTPLFFRNTGAQITSVGVKVDATTKAEFSAEFTGLSQNPATSPIASATYVVGTQGPLIGGGSAGSITIAGLSASYYSLDLKVSHERSASFALFNPNASRISTGSNRSAVLTLLLYRDDLTPETVFAPNTPISVSFTLGSGANSYTFAMPRCFAKRPKGENNDNSEMVSIELTAANDATAATDITCTKG